MTKVTDPGFSHFMVDIETLGSHARAPVVQIGAVGFHLESGIVGEPFKVNIAPDFSYCSPSWSTLCWWSAQSDDARSSVFTKDALTFNRAWDRFTDFIIDQSTGSVFVWAMPPEFDLAILRFHCDHFNRVAPWKYHATRDLRTLEHLVGGDKTMRVAATVAHDAAADAIAQAKTVSMYYNRLFNKPE